MSLKSGHRQRLFLILVLTLVSSGCATSWPKPSALFSLGASQDQVASESSLVWFERYDDALAEAKASGKLVLANFTGSDWCKWCVKLENDVLETEEFEQWSTDRVVLLKLDYPRSGNQTDAIREQNDSLKKKYQITSFPTVLMLNGDGNVVGKMGYMPQPSAWISRVESQLK